MVKGIINAFDHMEFCLVIDLTMDGNQVVIRLSMFATRRVSFATALYMLPGSKYCKRS